MIRRDDFGRYAAPALRAIGLVRQGLPDDGEGLALRSDLLDNAIGSRQPLPWPGIRRWSGCGASPGAYLGSGELVTRPDVHIIHGIRWPPAGAQLILPPGTKAIMVVNNGLAVSLAKS